MCGAHFERHMAAVGIDATVEGNATLPDGGHRSVIDAVSGPAFAKRLRAEGLAGAGARASGQLMMFGRSRPQPPALGRVAPPSSGRASTGVWRGRELRVRARLASSRLTASSSSAAPGCSSSNITGRKAVRQRRGARGDQVKVIDELAEPPDCPGF